MSQLGPQKRHLAPYAWIDHKHLRVEMADCFNAHLQPKQDPHVDLDIYRYLQALKSIGATLLSLPCRSTLLAIRVYAIVMCFDCTLV